MPLTESQLSPVETELIVIVPPPEFAIPNVPFAVALAATADKATIDFVSVNCGGSELILSVTATFCEFPEQGLDAAHVRTIDVVYGEPVAASESAWLFSDTLRLPGVFSEPPNPPVTVSHGAAGFTLT